MKNVRKAIVLALALVMALSLAACAGGSSPSPAAPGGTPAAPAAPGGSVGSADLTMWHIHTGENRNVPIQEGIDEFTAANPGVSVNVEIIANDVYKTQLRTAMAGGGGPCIFHSWGGGWLEAFVREGLVVDITDDVGGMTGNLVESAVRMTTIDGRLWGLPIINSGTFLYYNQKMFAELGINPPNTFAELENVVDTLKANNIVPFAEANLTRWPGAQHFVFLSMRLGGPDIFARAMAGEERFDHPAFIQAGEMLTDMVKNGWFPEGHNGMNWDTGESRTMFFLEQAGMILQTSGFISTAFNDAPDFFPNLGIHEYPSIAGGAGLKTDMLSGINAFSVTTYSPAPRVAAALVGHLPNSTITQQGLANGGTIAVLDGTTYANDKMQGAVSLLGGATFMQNFIDQTMTPRLTDAHLGTAQALHGLTMTAQEAAAEMVRVFEADDGSFD